MRDLILVLAAALLLRVCTQQVGDQEVPPNRPSAPAPMPSQAAGATAAREQWQPEEEDGAALLFREEGRAPIAAIRCDAASSTLVIARVATAPSGAIGTMTISADNRIRSLPVSTDRSGIPMAAARLKLSDRMVDSLARGSGRMELALDGEPSLVLPLDRQFAPLIETCRLGASE